MDKLIKLFPFMPAEKDGGKLALAIVFYVFVPSIAASILGAIFGFTLILLPLAFVVGLAASVYSVLGIVFAIMYYCGRDIAAPKAEAPAEEAPAEEQE